MQHPVSPRPQKRLLLLLAGALFSLSPFFCAAVLASSEEAVPASILASFETFSKGWMSRLEQVNQQNSKALKPEPGANGRLVGRYLHYGPDCAGEVRRTNSRVTPYVGILRYAQKVMEKEGETPQKLREHPGVATGEVQVTEIFRYSGGRWVY